MTAQGVSFRHAVELLREASPALSVLSKTRPWKGPGPAAKSTAPKLPSLVEVDAADQELLNTVVGYYAETLATHDEARAFLARRRIDHPQVVETFRLGFADRTLGLPDPGQPDRGGQADPLAVAGTRDLRATGHEHFRGSLVVPVIDEAGDVGEVYGRKIRDDLRAGTPKHLYLPGPHRGVFNIAAFAETSELIVCESLIDALTLWCAGFRHVTATYGTDGWTPDHRAAVERHGIGRVLIAFDADDAGDRGAKQLAENLAEAGVETFRVQLPRGTDVNQIAMEAGPEGSPTEVLGRFLRKATWLDTERPVPQPPAAVVPRGLDSPAHAIEPVEPKPVVKQVEPPRVWWRVLTSSGRLEPCRHRGSTATRCASARFVWSRRR